MTNPTVHHTTSYAFQNCLIQLSKPARNLDWRFLPTHGRCSLFVFLSPVINALSRGGQCSERFTVIADLTPPISWRAVGIPIRKALRNSPALPTPHRTALWRVPVWALGASHASRSTYMLQHSTTVMYDRRSWNGSALARLV